jgi:nitrogen fixation protein FixH
MSTSTINTSPTKKRELTAQLAWTAFILLFFVVQAILWTVAISVTSQDASHAVVTDYDQQALHWDAVKQRRTASQALGWSATASFGDTADVRGIREVTIKLIDDQNKPIKHAEVDVRVFHRGHAANVQTLKLTHVADGCYRAKIPVRHDGWWVFDGVAKVGDKEYLISTSIQIKR